MSENHFTFSLIRK